MSAYFETFGQWLGRKVGAHKASLIIHRHLLFFMEIERRWRTIPKYDVLLMYFGTAKLRQVLLPMQWMEEYGLVMVDAKAKKEDSEKRQIADILGKLPSMSRERAILEGYCQVMMGKLKRGETTLCSIRLALSPSALLLTKAKEMGRMPPDQKVLDACLRKTPGQRAAVSGFVRYLREMHGAEIVLPKNDAWMARWARQKRLEAEMLALMEEGVKGGDVEQQWLSLALAYFHGLPRKVGKIVQSEQITVHEDGNLTIVWESQKYWIPSMVKSLSA